MEQKVTLESLIDILENAKTDYYKLYSKNNKAAAARLRKSLQDVSKLCKTAREQAIEHKKSI